MLRSMLIVCLSFVSVSLHAADQQKQGGARQLVHLLDYLAKDYVGAVSEDGRVLSDSEFAEQREFAKTAYDASLKVPELTNEAAIRAGIKGLHEAIESKTAPSRVVLLARSLQNLVIEKTKLEVSPSRWPDLVNAAKLFSSHCASCHGTLGAGDGVAGAALTPKPANFLNHEKMDGASPSGEFNTIRLGVPGTAMAGFSNLSDVETWSLAFYVVSLRHTKPTVDIKLVFDPQLLKNAATLSDIDLAKVLDVPLREQGGKLASVRLHQSSDEKVNTLDLARTYLNDAESAFRSGDQSAAKDRALRSYLEGIEPVEPRLRAQAPGLVTKLETAMLAVRASIEQNKTAEEVHENIGAALSQIDEADSSLKSQGIDNRVAFIAAAGILLREGFEAALVILSLLSVIRAVGAHRAALWVHAGWIAALCLGVVFWFAAGVLFDVSGAQRELLEGCTSVLAVFILIGVGFWMHRHSEIGRWTKFIKEKVQVAVDGKNLMGLATISFLAVAREALESVLFLRIIWFEANESAKTSMLSGIGLTLAFIVICCWAAVKFSAKLPISRLFQISAYIMAALAFILTGKGIHSLQESGIVGITQLMSQLRFELVGVYPSLETLLAQIIVIAIIAVLWIQGRKPTLAKS
ncbi:MAG: cytochrome c/FTR1 family iron permease [Chitinophagaceae bacterium]|nr:cytochrome c/FTR1 family iron permease [Oligoflexus sp.]